MLLAGAGFTFAFLVAILSVLRARILFEFSSVSLLLFGSTTIGSWLYSLFFLPGTILHELSHWIVAELLGVRTGEITILPDFENNHDQNHQKLGSVQTESTGPIRSFLIGAAPFLTGIITLYILGILLQDTWVSWQYVLIFYAIIVVGSSMLLSREDRRSWPFIGILVLFLTAIFYLTPLDIPVTWIDPIAQVFWSLNQVLGITIGAVVVIIGITYVIRRIIEKILGKKIIRR